MDKLERLKLDELHKEFFPCDECVMKRDGEKCKRFLTEDKFTQHELGCYKND